MTSPAYSWGNEYAGDVVSGLGFGVPGRWRAVGSRYPVMTVVT